MAVDPATIDLLVMDVDGVLTDGRIWYDDAQRELKGFDAKDGAGLKYWHRAQGPRKKKKTSAILTGRSSPLVERRGAELGVTVIRQGAKDKLPVLREILAELNVSAERAAYMGDDLPDLPCMRACGLSIAVADAVEEVRATADWVSPCGGGCGAVRWAIERLLRAGGLWDQIMSQYA